MDDTSRSRGASAAYVIAEVCRRWPAISRRDFRFLAVSGFTEIPGVPTAKDNVFVRTLPGTSDSPVSAELQLSAIRYAETYNKRLLDHLSRQRWACLPRWWFSAWNGTAGRWGNGAF